MVGRLIQDEQVDRCKQEPDHSQTAAFSSRQHLDLLLAGLTTKHEGTQYIIDTGTDRTGSHIVNGIMDSHLII